GKKARTTTTASKPVERRKAAAPRAARKGVAAKSPRLSVEEARKVQRRALLEKSQGKVRVAKGGNRSRMKLAAHVRQPKAAVMRVAAVPRLSRGEQLGLRDSSDLLELNSSVALVMD